MTTAPTDTVWRAVREPEEIRRWFGWEYGGLDDEIRSILSETAEVSEAEKPSSGSTATDSPSGRMGSQTVVRVTRAASAGATRHEVDDDISEGWITLVQQLRFALEVTLAKTAARCTSAARRSTSTRSRSRQHSA